MTPKSRYFLVGSSAVLLIGLGAGLVAFYTYSARQSDPTLPAELRWVPSDADMVAYANVTAVMNSQLRRDLEAMAGHGPGGKHPMLEAAGIDLEKQVSHVVAYANPRKNGSAGAPPMLVLVRGTFDQPKIEEFLTQHGGTAEDYTGKRLFLKQSTGRQGDEAVTAVAFIEPGLVGLGHVDLVRRALGASTASAGGRDISSNRELMELIRGASGSTVWAVGRFDAVTKSAGVSERLAQQVPPLRYVSASADINGGLKARVRAETADQAAADQLRETIRGFVSLIRIQAASKPELQAALKSFELGGTGSTVQMSFALTPETLRAIAPARRPRPEALPAPH